MNPQAISRCYVERMLSYTVYLSAVHLLESRHYGSRLDTILREYPRNTTNLWPYLRLREREVFERRRMFAQTFLGRYTRTLGINPLSDRLWGNPDNRFQVEIALR